MVIINSNTIIKVRLVSSDKLKIYNTGIFFRSFIEYLDFNGCLHLINIKNY